MPVSQAEPSQREVHAAVIVHLDPVPLDQQIKHRHSVSQPALKIGPDPMHHFLEMAHQRQHRQHRFDDHAGVPFALPAKAQVLRLPICFGKAFVTEQDHALGIALGQVLEGTAVVDVCGVESQSTTSPR